MYEDDTTVRIIWSNPAIIDWFFWLLLNSFFSQLVPFRIWILCFPSFPKCQFSQLNIKCYVWHLSYFSGCILPNALQGESCWNVLFCNPRFEALLSFSLSRHTCWEAVMQNRGHAIIVLTHNNRRTKRNVLEALMYFTLCVLWSEWIFCNV